MESTDLSSLVNRYSKKIYNLAYHMLGNMQDAEDVMQETFLQVYQHLKDFRGDSNVYTWIYKIAFNTCLRFKKEKERAYLESLEEKLDYYQDKFPLFQSDLQNTPEDTVIMNELTGIIRKECHQVVMHRLPEKQKQVFIMKVILDLSYQEIVEILGITENVIKIKLHRARVNLLSHFNNNYQWFLNGETSCCKKKLGLILVKDTEALKRVYEQMKAMELTPSDAFVEQDYRRIDDIYGNHPLLEPNMETLHQ